MCVCASGSQVFAGPQYNGEEITVESSSSTVEGSEGEGEAASTLEHNWVRKEELGEYFEDPE